MRPSDHRVAHAAFFEHGNRLVQTAFIDAHEHAARGLGVGHKVI